MGETVKRNKPQRFGFLLQGTLHLCQGLYKILKVLAQTAGEKSVTFMRKKTKWTNKWNDKHEDADSLLHNTTSLFQCLYNLSKSWVL